MIRSTRTGAAEPRSCWGLLRRSRTPSWAARWGVDPRGGVGYLREIVTVSCARNLLGPTAMRRILGIASYLCLLAACDVGSVPAGDDTGGTPDSRPPPGTPDATPVQQGVCKNTVVAVGNGHH